MAFNFLKNLFKKKKRSEESIHSDHKTIPCKEEIREESIINDIPKKDVISNERILEVPKVYKTSNMVQGGLVDLSIATKESETKSENKVFIVKDKNDLFKYEVYDLSNSLVGKYKTVYQLYKSLNLPKSTVVGYLKRKYPMTENNLKTENLNIKPLKGKFVIKNTRWQES